METKPGSRKRSPFFIAAVFTVLSFTVSGCSTFDDAYRSLTVALPQAFDDPQASNSGSDTGVAGGPLARASSVALTISYYAAAFFANSIPSQTPSAVVRRRTAVCVGGVWYLLDTTWDSGYIDGSRFVQAYTNSYFLLSPDKMIYTHMPNGYGVAAARPAAQRRRVFIAPLSPWIVLSGRCPRLGRAI